MESTDRPTVTIFVRKGTDDLERKLSFSHEGIDQQALLDRGIAIDGNAAVLTVRAVEVESDGDGSSMWAYIGPYVEFIPRTDNDHIIPWTFTSVLAHVEREVQQFLVDLGFDVRFA